MVLRTMRSGVIWRTQGTVPTFQSFGCITPILTAFGRNGKLLETATLLEVHIVFSHEDLETNRSRKHP